MKYCYVECDFKPATVAVIEQANTIIAEYRDQGYDLTLRQLYYQFVSRDLIPNRQTEYKKLGGTISNARRAGLIDWHAIVDRTRFLRGVSHGFESPGDYIMPEGYRVDRWEGQPYYIEVWIEKDALVGVFERVCGELDVAYLSCRGYTSDSEIWGAAQRLRGKADEGKLPVLLHFGDHDPSGLDMTRDVADRIELLGGPALELRRLALNMDQVREYEPPPNPAKETDSRFRGYIAKYGGKSWELDALEPSVLADLVRDAVEPLIDREAWSGRLEEEERGKTALRKVAAELSE